MWTAKRLNDHIAQGGGVQITTQTRSTVYQATSRPGFTWFTEVNGRLYVARGKRRDCLGPVEAPLVGIRLSRL